MTDLFVGTWKLNPGKSHYDENHRPSEGTMHFRVAPGGGYLMLAEGRNAKGEQVAEAPQTLIPDGRPYPVPGFPGLTTVTTRSQPHTIEAEVRREDGSIVGHGSYVLSDDGASMTATTAGYDTQLRRFEMKTVWDRDAG
jgi:hypothetical protein